MRNLGKGLFEQLQTLPAQLDLNVAHARDVSTGPRKTGYDPAANGIATQHDDGSGLGYLLGGKSRNGSWGHNNISLELHQLSSEAGEEIVTASMRTILNGNIVPFNPTEVAQPVPECIQPRRRCIPEHPNPRNFLGLLCLGGQAKRNEHGAYHKANDFFTHCFSC